MDKALFTGWGNTIQTESVLCEPENREETRKFLFTLDDKGGIPRGSGRSYGDQAMNKDGAIIRPVSQPHTKLLIRDNGVIKVEASLTITNILRGIGASRWCLPVIPGTGFVTIGGAIAADIHGKNHYQKSSIADHVVEMTLMLADGSIITCSQETETDLFWATIGGLGLTGIILNATLQLTPIQSNRIQVTSQRFHNFPDLFEQMKFTSAEFDHSVAWIDLISTGSRTGRGIFETGDHDTVETVDGRDSSYAVRTIANIPTRFPSRILNRTSGKAYNALRYFLASEGKSNRSVSISDFMHPLDRIGNWNRLYGPTGFIQWQVAIPEQSENILIDLVNSISVSEIPAFLGVLKKFGPANKSPLSFPIQGWTLAVDFPAKHHSLKKFLDALDREVLNAGGRVYLVKDARMDSSLVPKMYPRLEEWSTIRDHVDPNRRWQSDFSRRLNL